MRALVPSSLSNSTQDALGNPIDDPRRNLLNHTGLEGDRAVVPYDSALNVTDAMELYVWGNFHINNGVSQLKRFVDRLNDLNNDRVFLFFRRAADSAVDGKCRFIISSDGVNSTWTGSFIVTDAHSLLRIQYNGTGGTVKIWEYNSGAWTELTVTTEAGTVPASLFSTDIPIYLPGTFDTSDPDQYWEGQQSPLWMYDRLLTDQEADQVLKATKSKYGS